MLTVDRISKRYGSHLALKETSFTAEKGEIIGLLGRNGAGKSTLMNILTGYLAMTTGQAAAAGFDVQREPMQARRHIGYLPEQPPLYLDMSVTEYLTYCAQLTGLGRQQAQRAIGDVIERTGLTDYRRRLAGHLSKGYRQRLGLAQALLGSPELLILDEPGNGLDPLQLVQMREVIRHAAQESMVLLSSHMLGEVTDVCTRAIVLDQGQCLYDGSMQALLSRRGMMTLCWQGGDRVTEAVEGISGVQVVEEKARKDGGVCATLRLPDRPGICGELVRAVTGSGAELREMTPAKADLEDAFLHLIASKEAEA